MINVNYAAQDRLRALLFGAGVGVGDPSLVRPDIQQALDDWRRGMHPQQPGDFLESVLKGDFRTALQHADHYNLLTFGAVYSWLYNYMPEGLWGSSEKYNAHLGQMRASLGWRRAEL